MPRWFLCPIFYGSCLSFSPQLPGVKNVNIDIFGSASCVEIGLKESNRAASPMKVLRTEPLWYLVLYSFLGGHQIMCPKTQFSVFSGLLVPT
jgi:hypothetical protein